MAGGYCHEVTTETLFLLRPLVSSGPAHGGSKGLRWRGMPENAARPSLPELADTIPEGRRGAAGKNASVGEDVSGLLEALQDGSPVVCAA